MSRWEHRYGKYDEEGVGEAARRLWAEVRWWRDHQQHMPWLPPVGAEDGQRYRRLMSRMDSDFAADPEAHMALPPYVPPDSRQLPPDFEASLSLPPELEGELAALLGEMPLEAGGETAVDWRYLDLLDSDSVDQS